MPYFSTFLEVVNNTHDDIRTKIRSVDDFDWDASCRPDNNFHDQLIKRGDSLKQREEINILASANMFTLDLIINGAIELSFRIDQGIASGRREYTSDYVPSFLKNTVSRCVNYGAQLFDIGMAAADYFYQYQQYRERGTFLYTGNTEKYRVQQSVDNSTVRIEICDCP